MKKRKSIAGFSVLVIVATLLFCSGEISRAGMIDDWMTNTASSPGYYEGQKRGYLFGGSFSARWPSTNDYPITIMKPRLSLGCGGIDGFLGGFSFMGFDYLVDKLQAMIMNAPAIAFDLALNALAQQVSSSSKTFEQIINTLNSLQMDECQGAKNLLAIGGLDDKAVSFGNYLGGKLGGSIAEAETTLGLSSFWHAVSREIQSNNFIDAGDVENTTQDCPVEIKDLLLSNNGGGFILANLGEALGLPTSYVDMMRGFFGDIRVGSSGEGYKTTLIEACPDNDPTDVNALITGNIFAKNTTGTCYQVTDVNADFTQYAADQLIVLRDSIKNKTQITDTDTLDFLNQNPVPVYSAMKTAVATGQETTYMAQLSTISAKAMAYKMMSDFFDRIYYLANKGLVLLSATGEPTPGGSLATCQIAIHGQGIKKGLEGMSKQVYQVQGLLGQSYTQEMESAQGMFGYLKLFRETNQDLNKELSQRYGTSMASRLR